MKYFVFMDFIEENKDFKFLNVELGCHFCSFFRKIHLYVQGPGQNFESVGANLPTYLMNW